MSWRIDVEQPTEFELLIILEQNDIRILLYNSMGL